MYYVIDLTASYGFAIPKLVADLLIVGGAASALGALTGLVWWTAQGLDQ